jgi:hypothetical protein
MVTTNEEGIKIKGMVKIVNVGRIIINTRKTLIMRSQITMLVRERKKGER